MSKKRFTNYLLKISGEATGCQIQTKGSPCNTCFHNWAENELGLHPKLSHALWLINLSLRGDYSKEAIAEDLDNHRATPPKK